MKNFFVMVTFIFVFIAMATISSFATPTVLFEDNFNAENSGYGALNYSPSKWNVVDGTVDLIGNGYYDFFPGNGLYLDMDGSTANAGTIVNKDLLTLTPGIYELEFALGGNWRGYPADTIKVSLGSVYSETFLRNSGDYLATVSRTINVISPTSGNLIFDHEGYDNVGISLDNVKLTQTTVTPEPISSALFLLGGVVLGMKQYKKRKKDSI
ncbi:hypothetical protein HZA55_08935 [Candidatus Poribacteria bacterium]|nr:hypothetical protein [Candidatus Poribacteria bacterium]